METHVQKWGNSLGLRIPSKLANQLRLKDGVKIDLKIEDDHLSIYPKKYSLRDMLEQITSENLHSIELDSDSIGREEW